MIVEGQEKKNNWQRDRNMTIYETNFDFDRNSFPT